VAIERRSAAPLVRLGILRSAPLVRANVGAMLFVGAFIAFQFVLVLYLQELRAWTPLEAGLVVLIVGIDTVLAPTVTPRLVNRYGTIPVIVAGIALSIVAYALFLRLGIDWTYWAMLPTMLILGLAFTLTYGPLTIAATDGIAEDEQGLASGLLNVSVQFGAALGLAVATAISVAVTGDGGSPEALLDGYQAALLVPLAAVAIALAVTALGLRARAGRKAQADRGGAVVAEAAR
jgi:predicted MFS family arabinose efflux permease